MQMLKVLNFETEKIWNPKETKGSKPNILQNTRYDIEKPTDIPPAKIENERREGPKTPKTPKTTAQKHGKP